MKYDEDDIGENGHTKEYNQYIPLIKGLNYSLMVLFIFWILTLK